MELPSCIHTGCWVYIEAYGGYLRTDVFTLENMFIVHGELQFGCRIPEDGPEYTIPQYTPMYWRHNTLVCRKANVVRNQRAINYTEGRW